MGDEGSVSYTLDEALGAIGFGRFQLIVLAYAGLGWVAEAMEMMLLSFVGPAMKPEWGLSASQESLISTVAFGGMLVGAYSWGRVSDAYGRKKGFLGASILTTLAGFSCAFAPNYISLLILRCLVGAGLSCAHVFTSWFLEFVPIPNRGAWMVVFATFWTVGTIMEASLAWWIMPRYGWRWLLGLSAVPSLMLLLFFRLVPESPRYLSTQGRLAEAQQILKHGAALNRKELPVGLLVSDHIKTKTNDDNNESLESKTSSSQRSSSSLPGLGLAAILLDRVGRKISMVIMLVSGFVLLLPLIVHQNEVITTGSLFGSRMFISASFIIVLIYAPEVYPTNLRTTGVGIATAIGRTGGMVYPLIVVGMKAGCHQTVPVILFEVTILLCGLSVVILPFETKGKELTDTIDLPVQVK
ncbi:putative major facilitator, sugar transporter, major facilitator superfamily [Helianthus annuus]|uniref:Major facilitator, sugar transporter, major facilitator superfamily n=1 Tax=Helianthus annuus TaxID=4232 RepID=A0A9K3N5E5_HELAN|nr:putative major facilitator, sugar transporter, major facilitator superfamily [Helianthus annuus]KAJ0514874.1 putative major facilitator, sugar transporter, major facilitator superfamily [Helianthus annuus]KAJ0531038.1 putative major facilitator, sugar transporter, major facilitator superfamily [Helianthus annuus]KAJ0697886.1 putative major facilitator, sugar transporter, major facilitator superfamily [Helianthus annuus]KAJ0701252.1 putative major facilitator, sugar transporter, major facilit